MSSAQRELLIVAVGARTALGLNVAQVVTAARAHRIDDALCGGNARVRSLPAAASLEQRLLHLGTAALLEVIEGRGARPTPIVLVLAGSQQVVERRRARLLLGELVRAAKLEEHAQSEIFVGSPLASLKAIEFARKYLEANPNERIIVGAIDCVSGSAPSQSEDGLLLPPDEPPGSEGAAFLMLEFAPRASEQTAIRGVTKLALSPPRNVLRLLHRALPVDPSRVALAWPAFGADRGVPATWGLTRELDPSMGRVETTDAATHHGQLGVAAPFVLAVQAATGGSVEGEPRTLLLPMFAEGEMGLWALERGTLPLHLNGVPPSEPSPLELQHLRHMGRSLINELECLSVHLRDGTSAPASGREGFHRRALACRDALLALTVGKPKLEQLERELLAALPEPLDVEARRFAFNLLRGG